MKVLIEMIRSIGSFLSLYRWQYGTLAVIILFPFVWFREEYWTEILSKANDVDWWADNVLALVLFSVLINFALIRTQKIDEGRRKKKFDWTLRITNIEGATKERKIYWRDAERYAENDDELWKYLKGAISVHGWLKLDGIDSAREKGMLVQPAGSKLIVVDLQVLKENIDFDPLDKSTRR